MVYGGDCYGKNVFLQLPLHSGLFACFSDSNMGVVDGNKPAHDNDWEEVAMGGEKGGSEMD